MASRLKEQDIPEAWLTPKKKHDRRLEDEVALKELATNVEVLNESTSLPKRTKRGRGRPKGKTKMIQSGKGKCKSKSVSASAADVILGRSKTPVNDVEELRRKIEQDAVACGRQLRSVLEMPDTLRSQKTVTLNPAAAVCEDGQGQALSCGGRSSLLKSQRIETSGDCVKELEESEPFFMEGSNVKEVRSSHRHGKEPMVEESQETEQASRSTPNSGICQAQSTAIDREDMSSSRHLRVNAPHRSRSLSPNLPKWDSNASTEILTQRREEVQLRRFDYGEDGLPMRRSREEVRRRGCDSPDDGRLLRPSRRQQSISRSPERNWSQSSRMDEFRSRRRSVSVSPGRWREGQKQRSNQKEMELYRQSERADHIGQDYWTNNEFSSRGNRHMERYNSTPANRDVWRSTSQSPPEYLRHKRMSTPTRRSRSPPRMLTAAHDAIGPKRMGILTVKEESQMETSAAVGRRERRHDQVLREEDMATRERHGKKPFYLTLDPEGKPYGPGKPAWVAHINKLAAGLDPSCTHIRKQTYEAVQTFKSRLDDDFEYSGKLNEDHLRGLMGKAVTKRRGELISLIKSDGKQPFNIDARVWRRLEKLAYSKQREQKSEQGRYANSCRKTLGRTGSKGLDGVREKLRAVLGRSPHPDEVEEEMQRDKGYGGQKKKRRIHLSEREDGWGRIIVSDDDDGSKSLGENSLQSSSDSGSIEQFHRNRSPSRCKQSAAERSGRASGNVVDDGPMRMKRTTVERASWSGEETEKLSTDEYIQTLKAQIECLQSEKAKPSASNARQCPP